jgi:hypothetical protein
MRTDLPTGEPSDQGPAEVELDTAGGLPEVGRRLADFVRIRVPAAQSGRLALAWRRDSPWLTPVGEGFAANWPSCLLGEDLGIAALSAEQAYVQLDPGHFARLLWIEPRITPAGELAALDVELRSLGAGPTWSSSLLCRPPFPLGGARPDGQRRSPALEVWASFDEAPLALQGEPGGSRLWLAFSDRIVRLDVTTRQAVQEWSLPENPDRRDGSRAALADLTEGADVRIGWYDLSRAQGRVYEQEPGGRFTAAETTAGFPLPPRVQRFLTAPFDAESGEFVLTDFKGMEVARCLDVVRFSGPEGSLFGLLDSRGSLTVLKGSDLGLLNGPVAFPVSAAAEAGPVLLLARAFPPHEVMGFRLNSRGAWAEVWSSPPLPAPVTSLCAGGPEAAPLLFVSVRSDQGGLVHALPLSWRASP